MSNIDLARKRAKEARENPEKKEVLKEDETDTKKPKTNK